MLIFLGLEKVVDVNHLRSSMLIFSLLVPHPNVSTQLKNTLSYLKSVYLTHLPLQRLLPITYLKSEQSIIQELQQFNSLL